MAATAEAVPAPRAGLFSLVKLGVLIPARRWKLFVQVVALSAVPSTALFFVKTLALEPLAAALNLQQAAGGVGGTDDAFFHMLWPLLPAGAAYLIANAVLGSAINIANIFVSVVGHHEHEHDERQHHHSLVHFLRRVKRNAWGPVVTASFGYVLRAAYVGTTVVVSALSLFLLAERYPPWMLLLHVVVLFVALLFYMYLEVVCAVAMVASAAEPGLRGGVAAVRRAWRLMRGNTAQAVLYVASTWALGMAVSLAMAWLLPHGHGGATSSVVRVDAALMHLLVAALDVFSVAAVTAYYFQCRKSAKEDCTKSNDDDKQRDA